MRTMQANPMMDWMEEVVTAIRIAAKGGEPSPKTLELLDRLKDQAFPTPTPRTGSGLSDEDVNAAYVRGCLMDMDKRPLDYPHYRGLRAVADAAADAARKEQR